MMILLLLLRPSTITTPVLASYVVETRTCSTESADLLSAQSETLCLERPVLCDDFVAPLEYVFAAARNIIMCEHRPDSGGNCEDIIWERPDRLAKYRDAYVCTDTTHHETLDARTRRLAAALATHTARTYCGQARCPVSECICYTQHALMFVHMRRLTCM